LLPAFVFGLVAAVVVSLFTYRHDDEIQQEFTDTAAMIALPRARGALSTARVAGETP
jgi:sodium/proline symporter